MRSVRACRVCLATRVRLHRADALAGGSTTVLYDAYRDLTGITSLRAVHYVCYECARLLLRAHQLRDRSLRAHSLLEGILRDAGRITESDIAGVDRRSHLLTSPLKLHHNDGEAIIDIVYDETEHKLKEEIDVQSGKPAETVQDGNVWLLDIDRVKVEEEEENASEWERELVSSASSVRGDSSRASSPTPARRPTLDRSAVLRKKRAKLAKLAERPPRGSDSPSPPPKKTKRKSKKAKIERQRRPSSAEPKSTEPGKATAKVQREKRPKRFDPTVYEEFSTVIFMTKEDAVEEIHKRLQSSNYLMSTYRCEMCYRGFWQVASFNNHMQKHDPKMGEHECDVCRLRFESRRSLQHHQANFHRTKFLCKKCPHYCTNPPLARRHEDWHKGKVYTCKQCNENFKRVSTLQSHVRRLHASEFVCELCGLSFVGQRGIIAHKNRMHREEKRQDVKADGPHCADCDITFANEEAWKRHLVISAKHRGQTTNGCEICGETFPTAEELRLHHRSHARKYPAQYLHKKKNNGIAWPVECEQCKAQINSSQEYKNHFQKEHPDKNRTHFPVWRSSYMCETCGRVFRNQALLGYHQRKHTGERPFKCDACPKSFLNASYLAAHARMHTGDMPFECHLCGKRFNYKNNLERHMNIHSGLKPHKCEYCGKCFTQSSERKSHVDYVHHKKPWPKRDRGQRRKCDLAFC